MRYKIKPIAKNSRVNDLKGILGIISFYVILQLLGITCPIKFITGISCPGCGMTRAWMSLLCGDFSAAVTFHPLFWMPVPGLLFYLMKYRIRKGVYCVGMSAICVSFLIVYLFRMFMNENTIVSFHPNDSLFVKLIQRIFYG